MKKKQGKRSAQTAKHICIFSYLQQMKIFLESVNIYELQENL